jgi:glycosyltransferase involved in cell wall biosynthesis
MANFGIIEKKITKVLQVIRPAEGGMKGHLLMLAKGLINAGIHVEVACPENSVIAEAVRAEGLVVHPIDIIGPISFQNDITCIKQIKKIILHGKYDLIHFHGSKAGLVGRIAALLAGHKRTVLTVHNFVVYQEVPLVKRTIFKYGEYLLSHITSKIITVSNALKEDLVKNYGIKEDKIIPIYNGIDFFDYNKVSDKVREKFGLGINTDKPIVGTVARMAPQKGLEYLIKAVPIVLKKCDVLFVIAGDGPMMSELVEMVKQTGLQDKVLFPGYVKNISRFFACLDIFVIPSIAEGLSITTIEAMACGLPVVASNVGGLPELVGNEKNGLLVEPRNEAQLAEAITSLLRDSDARKRYGVIGKEAVSQKFTKETMVVNTINVYNEVMKMGAV